MKPSKQAVSLMRAENRKYGNAFTSIPPEQWNPAPDDFTAKWRNRVWRSRHFLVQEFVEHDGIIRLSINRTDVDRHGNWKDGITWDELQAIKNNLGFDRHTAVEIYPPADRTVNVANLRHLWIVPSTTPLPVWGVNR
jgi:hypothetical protein